MMCTWQKKSVWVNEAHIKEGALHSSCVQYFDVYEGVNVVNQLSLSSCRFITGCSSLPLCHILTIIFFYVFVFISCTLEHIFNGWKQRCRKKRKILRCTLNFLCSIHTHTRYLQDTDFAAPSSFMFCFYLQRKMSLAFEMTRKKWQTSTFMAFYSWR